MITKRLINCVVSVKVMITRLIVGLIRKTQYKTWVSIFMKHLIDKNVEVEMGLSN